jgi:hypothetical protein
VNLSVTLPTPVYLIWWIVLLAIIVVIVPLAIALLHRTLRAALQIRRYLAEMLKAGVGIAENTASIPALKETLGVAGEMVRVAGNLQQHTGAIAEVLAQRGSEGTRS